MEIIQGACEPARPRRRPCCGARLRQVAPGEPRLFVCVRAGVGHGEVRRGVDGDGRRAGGVEGDAGDLSVRRFPTRLETLTPAMRAGASDHVCGLDEIARLVQ
jgi:hypothetical protein